MTDRELKEIREKISCPQLGDTHYGEWGILTPNQRFTIKRMLDFIESQEQYIKNHVMGDVSDGYHTFNELYHHRAILFSVICNMFKEKAWKSKKHNTGDMYDGMFIVGIETPQGQATYHYDIEPYWDMFQVKELPNAPKWDGHTPEEAIKRISTLKTNNVISLPCKVGDTVWHKEEGYLLDSYKINFIYNDMTASNISRDLLFSVEDIGKTVFLTKEEAEQALKERE